ncbi:MAG: toxin-antitoxin system YwqK family antitoxin [Bacteroidales bacterium]|jgi:antitoxin component YwqK of YwqJK toxin-antitoxin module|nr:toxin-antitoxin system YwqK family antitoxin [Bacteroidales bacterium]OQA84704.1 MAG: MORN repeat variant [Bacteroidetes bacterium ADurb.Bin234]
MRNLLTFLFVGIICLSFSQSDTLNRTDKFGKKYGYWKKYDKKNKLEYEGRFYNGEPIGEFLYYHPNGKIKNISFFTANSPIVTTTMFHENGTKYAEGVYWNKNKDGKWLYYNSNGKLVAEENYLKGKLNGLSKIYSSKDSVLLEQTNWLNGQKHGLYSNYYITGALRTKMYYNYNKMHGTFENYYENGKLKNKGVYAQDFRNGKWVNYNEDGQELKIEYFDKGTITNMFLGFQTPGQWIKVDVNKIAYFYQKTSKTLIMQLKDSSTITIYDDLMRISKCATIEYFIFVNEHLLSSYDAIKKIIPSKKNPNEAKVILLCRPEFDVFTYDDYYQLLKSAFNPKPPKLE